MSVETSSLDIQEFLKIFNDYDANKNEEQQKEIVNELEKASKAFQQEHALQIFKESFRILDNHCLNYYELYRQKQKQKQNVFRNIQKNQEKLAQHQDIHDWTLTFMFDTMLQQDNSDSLLTQIKDLGQDKMSFDKSYIICEVLYQMVNQVKQSQEINQVLESVHTFLSKLFQKQLDAQHKSTKKSYYFACEGLLSKYIIKMVRLLLTIPHIKNKDLLKIDDVESFNLQAMSLQFKSTDKQILIKHYVVCFLFDIQDGNYLSSGLQNAIFNETFSPDSIKKVQEHLNSAFESLCPNKSEYLSNFLLQKKYNLFQNKKKNTQNIVYEPLTTYNESAMCKLLIDVHSDQKLSYHYVHSEEFKAQIGIFLIKAFCVAFGILEAERLQIIPSFFQTFLSIIKQYEYSDLENMNEFCTPIDRFVEKLCLNKPIYKQQQEEVLSAVSKLDPVYQEIANVCLKMYKKEVNLFMKIQLQIVLKAAKQCETIEGQNYLMSYIQTLFNDNKQEAIEGKFFNKKFWSIVVESNFNKFLPQQDQQTFLLFEKILTLIHQLFSQQTFETKIPNLFDEKSKAFVQNIYLIFMPELQNKLQASQEENKDIRDTLLELIEKINDLVRDR